MPHMWYQMFVRPELKQIWLTLNEFPMLYLHEGYDISITKHIGIDSKSTWNMSVPNFLIFLVVASFDIGRFSQISIQFFEAFRFVDKIDIFQSTTDRELSSAIFRKKTLL